MPIAAPTATGQKQKIGVQDYISAADGARFVLLRTDPDPVDTKPLEDAIALLATNEAADDKTVEALDKLVKAIDLKPLGDRVTALESKPVVTTDTVISDDDPTDGDWKHWFKRLYDRTAWKMAVIHYVQILKGEAWAMNAADWRDMAPPTHEIAAELSPGRFQITLPGGAVFSYETGRGQILDGLEFPADVYIGAQTEYRDAAGDLINRTARYQSIAPGSVALGMGRLDAPANAVTVAVILIKPDNSQVRYRYPLQP
jgi:hypothetical protein